MPDKEYHDGSHVGIHSLLDFEKDGPHAWRLYTHGKPVHFEPSEAMQIGTLTHKLILEGDARFNDSLWVKPKTYTNEKGEIKPWHGGAKACKDQELEAASKGLIAVKAEDVAMMMGMREAVRHEPRCAGFFRKGRPEVVIRRTLDGVPVQCKIDWMVVSGFDDQPDFSWEREVDLKTVDDLDSAPYEVWSQGYIRQRAWYRRMIRDEVGVTLPTCLLFVEKRIAHRVWVRDVTEDELDEADAKNMATFDRLAECWRSDKWPRPTSDEFQARLDAKKLEAQARRERETAWQM